MVEFGFQTTVADNVSGRKNISCTMFARGNYHRLKSMGILVVGETVSDKKTPLKRPKG